MPKVYVTIIILSQPDSGLKPESNESGDFVEKSNLNLIEFCVWFESQVLLLNHLELNHHLHHISISQVFWVQFVHLFLQARFSICKCIMNVVRSMKHVFSRFISTYLCIELKLLFPIYKGFSWKAQKANQIWVWIFYSSKQLKKAQLMMKFGSFFGKVEIDWN